VAAVAAGAGEAEFFESFSGVVLIGVGLELGTHEGLDFLGGGRSTLAERHLTTCSLGADSSGYIYYK
jgi:hypothetical protein